MYRITPFYRGTVVMWNISNFLRRVQLISDITYTESREKISKFQTNLF